jgi:hypothetical protein
MRRWPRLKEHGITIWRLREGIDEDLERFDEDGFSDVLDRDDRPDAAKVVAALHLIGRRKEIPTLARISGILHWPFHRVRTALCALEERKVVRRKKVRNPYPFLTSRPDSRCRAPFGPSDFQAAGDASDPRDQPLPEEKIDPARECPASQQAAERALRQLGMERYLRGDAA